MQWKKENVLILLSLLVLAFFLINMFSGGGRGRQQSRELIYSDFKNLVAAGEISNAQFVGDTRIEGFTLDGTPYRTYIPENDTKLVDFLRHFQVQINYTPEQGLPWYLNLLIHWGPFLLIFGIWIFLMRRMQGMGAGRLFSLGRSRAQKMDPDKMKITFKDVAGVEEAKSDLAETIEFLKDPTKFRKLTELGWILQEFNGFRQIGLGLLHSGNILEGNFHFIRIHLLSPASSKGEKPSCPHPLHPAHEEDPDSKNQKEWTPVNKQI